ncbi:uncharacterized protein LTR77_008894 [Saxophila tyrrhenica]|uniref:Nitrate reductase n=1 Tax=Saxophila tyrrhenica TaxID=1690608 RepID=A0AAV9NZ18_9PEZI|nr:hypothetical protein LTR77_008894 [Saxophila tyrrhenica]
MTEEENVHLRRTTADLPPTPPDSEDGGPEKAGTEIAASSSTPSFPLPPPTSTPTQVLDPDKKTPDSWLPRDPRLIRLTGVHPFNVEAPLTDLFNEGFLTSPELFYVRNHGYVPNCEDEDVLNWEFSIEGMVEHPIAMTLRDLLDQYEQRTYPITLVCAGNRRKEQNIVRKTKGFSWGAAGVSTALFTGVPLGELIHRAKPKRGARYLCMEGADKLPNGCYGTSVKLNWATDPNKGMMLAHAMNGEMLRPDHGKPLRVVIPGQIGGRSVKWLKRIVITSEPSDNWYHIYDNRVLPTMVSPEEAANNSTWWKDERYAIYDLSTNSAIAQPAHDQQLCLVGSEPVYRVRGYAYGGGGRRVTRVEITLDKGKTWRLANIDYAEDRYREARRQNLCGGVLDLWDHEASFCWCFWNLDISLEELGQSSDIFVRAMDESMNIQPRDMYWSVLGMMNNPWYRVTITKENDYLRFEHPTQPALLPGGWMERVKNAGGNLANGYWGEQIGGEEVPEPVTEAAAAEVKMTKDGLNNLITVDELRKHDKEENPWFVVNGEVYDGTDYLKDHPGGASSITAAAGMDATDEFVAIHSETAKAMLIEHHIGTLDEKGKAALAGEEGQPEVDSEPTAVFLQPRAWRKATLCNKKTVSWDTRIFSFKLDHGEQTLGLPVGQHLMIRLRDPVTREAIIRSYTPISQTTQKGTMDVLVKVYFNTNERKGGKMSQAMDALPVGHFVEFKGPIGKFRYLGHGRCTVNDVERRIKTFIMISGGSGITPIYQVFREIMQERSDDTRCVVLDSNRLLEDILCKEELDAHAKDNHEKCRLMYTLTSAPDGWEGLRGRIAAPLLKEHASRSAHGAGEAMVLVCGPEALEKTVHKALLEDGWKDDDLLFF